jgi:hypothetical protein
VSPLWLLRYNVGDETAGRMVELAP